MSTSGRSTNARSCMRGCGTVSSRARDASAAVEQQDRDRACAARCARSRPRRRCGAARSRCSAREQRARRQRRVERGDGVDVVGLRARRRRAARSRSSARRATTRVRGSRASARTRARELPARMARGCCRGRRRRRISSFGPRVGGGAAGVAVVGGASRPRPRERRLRLRAFVGLQHRVALVVARVGEAVPPLGEIRRSSPSSSPLRQRRSRKSQPARKRGCSSSRNGRWPERCSKRGCSDQISLIVASKRRGIAILLRLLARAPSSIASNSAGIGLPPRGLRRVPRREHLVPQQRREQECGRHAAVLAHAQHRCRRARAR